MGKIRPDGHRHRELGGVLGRRRVEDLVGRSARPASLVEQPDDPADVVSAEDGAHVRRPLEDELAILLGEAAADGDLQRPAAWPASDFR